MMSPEEDEVHQVVSFLRTGVTRMLLVANATNATTNSTTANNDFYQGAGAGSEGYSDVAWMIMWFLSLAAFVFCPFCGSARRRQLCWRRVRDRTWYHDDLIEGEETERQRRHRQEERARRRQQLHGHNEHFQVSKTQEDDIREQFLEVATEKYSNVIQKEDIFESDHQQVRSSSFRSNVNVDESRQQRGGTQQQHQQHQRNSADKTSPHQDDIEAPPPPPSTNSEDEASSRNNSRDHDDEEDAFMLVEDFQETNEVIRVPLPGQTHQRQTQSNNENDDDDDDEKKSSVTPVADRFAPNGCAICLSKYEDGEMITWSANPNCTHVFHKECVIHWYLAVGRKTQQRRQRTHPEMTELEILDSICKFPMLCPCCRQTFCYNPNDDKNIEKQHAMNISGETNAATTAAAVTTTPIPESIQPQRGVEIEATPTNDTEDTTTENDEQ